MKKPLVLCLLIASASLQACGAVIGAASKVSVASKAGGAVSGAVKGGTAIGGVAQVGTAAKVGIDASDATKVSAATVGASDGTSAANSRLTDKTSTTASEVTIPLPPEAQGFSQTNASRLPSSTRNNTKVPALPPVHIVKFTDEEKSFILLDQIDQLPAYKQRIYQRSLEATLNRIRREQMELSIELAKKVAKNELYYDNIQNRIVIEESSVDLLAVSIGAAAYIIYAENNASSDHSR